MESQATASSRPGDVVKIDVTAELDGYIADAARTVLVGTRRRLRAGCVNRRSRRSKARSRSPAPANVSPPSAAPSTPRRCATDSPSPASYPVTASAAAFTSRPTC